MKSAKQKKPGKVQHLVQKGGKAVEEMGSDELKQLVNFYRQKASDLELQLLQNQIKFNKLVINQAQSIPATKTVIEKKTK